MLRDSIHDHAQGAKKVAKTYSKIKADPNKKVAGFDFLVEAG